MSRLNPWNWNLTVRRVYVLTVCVLNLGLIAFVLLLGEEIKAHPAAFYELTGFVVAVTFTFLWGAAAKERGWMDGLISTVLYLITLFASVWILRRIATPFIAFL